MQQEVKYDYTAELTGTETDLSIIIKAVPFLPVQRPWAQRTE